MDQNPGDGLGVGQERDEGEGFLAGGTDQGEDLVDPSQKSGPLGGTEGGGIRCPRLCGLGLGSRGRGFWRKRKRWTGSLSGQGILLPGPGRDERSQGRIGGEDAMVAVAMDSGWGEDRGQAAQELEGGETRGGAACGVGLGQDVEDLVGTAADQVESVEGKATRKSWPQDANRALAKPWARIPHLR